MGMFLGLGRVEFGCSFPIRVQAVSELILMKKAKMSDSIEF